MNKAEAEFIYLGHGRTMNTRMKQLSASILRSVGEREARPPLFVNKDGQFQENPLVSASCIPLNLVLHVWDRAYKPL
jgi:hypothetical protein